MIPKIGQTIDVKKNDYNVGNKIANGLANKNNQMQNTIQSNPIESKLQREYYINFGASLKKTDGKSKKLKLVEDRYTAEAKNLMERAREIAKENGHREITELHIQKAALESIRNYIGDLGTGEKVFDLNSSYQLPVFFAQITTPETFSDKKKREKILPVLDEEIKQLDETFRKTRKPKSSLGGKPPILAERIVDGIFDIITSESGKAIASVEDAVVLQALHEENIKQGENHFRKFLMKFCESVMLDGRTPEEKVALRAYQEKAKNVLSNLAHGTNMFITYDKKTNPMYLVDTLVDVFSKEEKGFGNLNRSNTKITIFSSSTDTNFVMNKIADFAKDKANSHIIVLDMEDMMLNSGTAGQDGEGGIKATLTPEFLKAMNNPPKNLKIVLIEGKNSYLSNISNPMFKRAFENFGEASVPVLSAEQMKTAFREQPLLMHKIEAKFSKPAIDRIVDATALLDGAYPEKAQKMMKRLASCYIDKKEISEADVTKYLEEVKDSFRAATESSSVEIVFDTSKRLKDFWGKEATRKEAEQFVRQIKAGTLGTKGAIIYSQDGSVGCGRKFTAKAIAGETKSPYVEINALDFGTKEVNLFGNDIMTPENSIKKLFSLLTTQAEANPTKSAVLFIENFEFFSVGEQVSEYHQKAMSQMLREMENASKKGLNVLVLGSVSNPDLIGESTLKSSKFISRIEVESPSGTGNISAREKILSSFIKEEKLRLAGATEAERRQVVRLMAETTDYLPFIYLRNIVNQVKSVAFERGHRKIDKKDVVEAYLQLTTGRPVVKTISDFEKKITASHEKQHGFNLEWMRTILARKNVPWFMPDKVNFITLDPRSGYWGAMYNKFGGNEESSFEKLFATLVCDFGGYSAEKNFYNLQGPGISQDFEDATRIANAMVVQYGQGHHYGVKAMRGMPFPPSEDAKRLIEKDVDAILDNARLASDLLAKMSASYDKEFVEKYANLVGTGDCLVHGDTFREEIGNWVKKQSSAKQVEMEQIDKIILRIMDATKLGKKFNINAHSVPEGIRKLFKTSVSYVK